MLLVDIIAGLLIAHTPAGQTVFSVEPMAECGSRESPTCPIVPVCEPAPSPLCAPPRWSGFHGSWVRVETRETAELRYREIATALSKTTLRLLCRDEHGARVDECVPVRWGRKNKGRVKDLAIAGLTALILESGAREDVQVGRGRYRKPVDGGQGRGPGNEGCLMQIIPSMAPRFATWLSPEERKEALESRDGREAVMQSLVGRDQASLERCFEVGLRMLAGSRMRCERQLLSWYRERNLPFKEPEGAWVYGMFSFYGVGPKGAAGGCYDSNGGKTHARYRLFHVLLGKSDQLTFVPKDETASS